MVLLTEHISEESMSELFVHFVNHCLHLGSFGGVMRMQKLANDCARIAEQALMSVVGEMIDHIEHIFLKHALMHLVIASEVQQQT